MKAHFICLEPRYIGGSPASVSDGSLARHVAEQERRSCGHALTGAYGLDEQAVAITKGLDLIVFEMAERTSGWVVKDWITDKWYWWPFKVTCPKCKKTKVECKRGWLTEHQMKMDNSYRIHTCDAGTIDAVFVGKRLLEEYQQRFTYNGK
jgi:hypothetical protein